MHTLTSDFDRNDKPTSYERLHRQLAALLADESDLIANAANTSALLFGTLPEVNWVGFYFLRGTELVLGPFQGKPACVRIGLGKGVCGTAASQRVTVRVSDVHAFPGHIACDPDSRAEIVIPLLKGERLVGVLDIDSPVLGRFDEADQRGLEALAAGMIAASHA
jgi:GAF domain-containing protein